MLRTTGLRSLFKAPEYRGVAAWMRRARSLLVDSDPLFELPELLEKPPGTRVMVIAPHADDEALGCGGTLFKHHLAGDRIAAVFMTDGSKGDAFSDGIGGEALIELREREARAAAAVLGIDECVFLRNPDAALQCSPRAVEQLGQVLHALKPDILYAPSPFDTHRDHRQACAIAACALADCSWSVQVYLCETWAPVPANCAVVIDLEHKIQALRIYRSQMDGRELYVTGASALARYRGLTCLPGSDVAVECFLRVDRDAFVELARSAA
jgi:LmbE family N-acetylglucosaminyl deacetylase